MAKIEQALGRSSPFINVQPPAIIGQRAPTTTDTDYPKGQVWLDESASPAALYTHIGGGVWDQGGNAIATNTVYGLVRIDTDGTLASADDTHVATALAAKTYTDSVATAGAPVATESTAGIGELATDAEAVAGTPSTGALALLVTPSNLTPVFAAPPAIGGTTPAAATFTDLTADGTLDLDTTVAGHIKVTGAADFTIQSTAGSIVINGEQGVDDAIQLTSGSGGLAASVALSAVIASTETNADSVQLISAGGMDITATGAAGKDLDLVCTSGSLNLTAGEAIANSIVLSSTNGGIDILAPGASAGLDIDIVNTGGSVNISSSENAGDAITIDASAGGIQITNTGTAAEDISIASNGASLTFSSSENATDAISLNASHASGGVTIAAGTGGLLFGNQADCTTIDLGDFAPTASRTVTIGGGTVVTASVTDLVDIAPDGATTNADSVKQVDVLTGTVATGQSLLNLATGAITSGTHTVSIQTGNAAAGTVACNISTGTGTKTVSVGNADGLTTTAILGPVNINASQNNNVAICSGTSTGTLTLGNTAAGAVILNSGSTIAIGDASAGNVTLNSAGTIDIGDTSSGALTLNSGGAIAIGDASAGAITVLTNAGLSMTAATASNLTATGAGQDLTLASTLGTVIVNAGEDTPSAIYLHANGGVTETIKIHADLGTAANSLDLVSDVGGITLTSGLASADAINLAATNGGVDIDGALEVNIASSRAATGALTLAVSNAAANITMTGAVACTPDSITSDNAGVAASINTGVTLITTDGDSNEDNVTLADGLIAGQIKHFAVIAAGNAADSIKITPANMAGGTKITFAADPTGLGCSMVFDGTNWTVFANNGGTIA